MRALVKREGSAEIEERPIPVAGRGEVVVRTALASMCSADVACVDGIFETPQGRVLGHEAVGTIHEIGDGVRGFSPGQRVLAISTADGHCDNCQRGFTGHCSGLWGAYTHGITRDGTFAEYYVVSSAQMNLTPIPITVSDEAALCVADTLSSGFTAPERANIPLGATVVVFGLGHIGLAAALGSRLRGASVIVGVRAGRGDPELARHFGVSQVLSLGDGDPLDAIRELSSADGADLVIEASGNERAFGNAVRATRPGGEVCVLSSYDPSCAPALSLDLRDWGYGIGDKTIRGTFAMGGRERVGRILKLIEHGHVDPTPLLTHWLRLDDAPGLVDQLRQRAGGIVKPVIEF